MQACVENKSRGSLQCRTLTQQATTSSWRCFERKPCSVSSTMTQHGSSNPEQLAGTEPFLLGLTGSIGMGKSTCCRFFTALGVPVLDSDQVVHQLYSRGGAAVQPVGEVFPSAVVDGAIDRAKLSKCVVGNQAALSQLEALVHPLVSLHKAQFLVEMAQRQCRLVVLDIPLLYETGAEADCDAVVVVSAPGEVQRQRVLERPGMTGEKFAAILARQLPDAEKRSRADFVLDTGVPLEETEGHVAALVEGLQGRRGTAFRRVMEAARTTQYKSN